MACAPAVFAGRVHVAVVLLVLVVAVHAVPPTVMLDTFMKLVPVMVITVPVQPVVGDMEDTTGVGGRLLVWSYSMSRR